MAAFTSLLQSPDPRRAPRRQQQVAQDPTERLIGIVENATKDPLGQEVLRGILKDRLNISIPTREEYQLQQVQTAQAQQEIARKQKQEQVRSTLGFLVDNAQAPADQALAQFAAGNGLQLPQEAIQALSGMTLEEALNRQAQASNGKPIGRLDGSLIQNPNNLTRASVLLGSVLSTGAPDDYRAAVGDYFKVGYGDLLDFGLTKEQAAKTETDLAREEASAAAGAARDTATELEAATAFQGDFLDPLRAKVEDQLGVDLTSNLFGRGDLESAAGVRGIATLQAATKSAFPQLSGEQLLNRVLPFYEDAEIPQIVMEGSRIDPLPDGGAVIVPENPTSALYLKLLRGLAVDAGAGGEEAIYARLAIPATQSDGDAIEALTAQARREP